MHFVALSNRYAEAISRLEVSVAEADNELQICDFRWDFHFDESWPRFVSAKKCVEEANNIFTHINVVWYAIVRATAATSEYRIMLVFG